MAEYISDKNVYIYGNYVYARKLDLDLEIMRKSASEMNSLINDVISKDDFQSGNNPPKGQRPGGPNGQGGPGGPNRQGGPGGPGGPNGQGGPGGPNGQGGPDGRYRYLNRDQNNQQQFPQNNQPMNPPREADPNNVFGGAVTGQSTLNTKLYARYNMLMYPYQGLHQLHSEIKSLFHDLNTDTFQDYYMQCWLNYYYKGNYIGWHGHWPTQAYSWHGFYCLDTEPDSHTSYHILEEDYKFDVPSEDNLLVISRSGRDRHRSSSWGHDRPRKTIAFDIVPGDFLREAFGRRGRPDINHWVPV